MEKFVPNENIRKHEKKILHLICPILWNFIMKGNFCAFPLVESHIIRGSLTGSGKLFYFSGKGKEVYRPLFFVGGKLNIYPSLN